MSQEFETTTEQRIQPNLALQEPPLYKVVYLNDEVTTMEFVVDSLCEFFDYNPDTASNITTDIHSNGSAIVAVLPYEIAEQKGIEVTLDARSKGFPLQVRVEAEA
jgi:ATP-dependent Clp protease adaptor protein ClpS|tara:strand:+ start:774 stop:1088 length:315 start_codon:yes stop_codon:yes gene_type:complete